MKVAIALPPGSRFCAHRPNSMETVVRTLREATGDDAHVRVFCDAGASDHGPGDVAVVPVGPDRNAALVRAIAAWKPDVVESHQHGHAGRVLARGLRSAAAQIYYRHNDIKAPTDPVRGLIARHKLSPFDGIVFVSDASRRAFADGHPWLASRAHAVVNPIDTDAWRACPVERAPHIVFAARAMPEKGLDLVCEALPAVLARHPGWSATLFLSDWELHADWAEPRVARAQAGCARIAVRRNAPLAEVRDGLRRSAIALVPSVWAEPLGLTALEAHAAGAALISSGRGGLREASGPHALYLDALDASGLANAMERLIADPALRLRLALAGQDHVARVHSPRRRAEQLHALRRALIDQRRAR